MTLNRVGPGLAGALFFEVFDVFDVREETMRADRYLVIAEVNDTRFNPGSVNYRDGVKVQCTMRFSMGRWIVETVHHVWTLAGAQPYKSDIENAKEKACLQALARSEAELADKCRELQHRIDQLEGRGDEPVSESEQGETGVKWERVEKLIADYEGWELTVEPTERSGWKWTAQWNGHGGTETRTVSWYAATRRKAQQDAVAAVDMRNR